ncbi:hypothetical protein ACTPEO_18390 [Clostridioides difficile]
MSNQFADLRYLEFLKDGVISKDFETSFPLEVAEMLLTLSNFYLDNILS